MPLCSRLNYSVSVSVMTVFQGSRGLVYGSFLNRPIVEVEDESCPNGTFREVGSVLFWNLSPIVLSPFKKQRRKINSSDRCPVPFERTSYL